MKNIKLTDAYKYNLNRINLNNVSTIEDILRLLKNHDKDTYNFSINTAMLCFALAKEYGITDTSELHKVFKAGALHDVGKLGMSYEFLNYSGSYADEMIKEMQKHTLGGAYILSKINCSDEIIKAVKFHHCNYNGSGYPGNLYEEEIPFYARIIRICDSLDAYMSKRCYKEGGPVREAFCNLDQYNNEWYDPKLMSFLKSLHNKVLRACAKLRASKPSQHTYMNRLVYIYCGDIPSIEMLNSNLTAV